MKTATNKQAKKQLAKCKLLAARSWPYASTAILSLQSVETMGVKDLAVDAQWRTYYNPEWIVKAEQLEVAAKILTEVGHLMLGHARRAQNYVPNDPTARQAWSLAADMAVHQILPQKIRELVDSQTESRSNPATYGFPTNHMAEGYFRLIMEKISNEQQSSSSSANKPNGLGGTGGNGASGSGNGAGQGNAPHGPNAQDPGSPEPQTDGDGDQSGEDQTGGDGEGGRSHPEWWESDVDRDEGSCSDGVTREWECELAEEAPGLEDYEQKQILTDCAIRGRKAGTVGSNMEAYVDGILEPKIDPRRLLMGVVRGYTDQITLGDGDRYTYKRPARRSRGDGMLRPRAAHTAPRILILVDTSGSMCQFDLAASLGLIDKVISGLHLRDGVRVIAGDTYAKSDAQVFDASKVSLIGGGGTDMSILIRHADDMKRDEKPQLCIVCTDGYTPWPSSKASFPVVACLTQDTSEDVPGWIKTVNLYEYCQAQGE